MFKRFISLLLIATMLFTTWGVGINTSAYSSNSSPSVITTATDSNENLQTNEVKNAIANGVEFAYYFDIMDVKENQSSLATCADIEGAIKKIYTSLNDVYDRKFSNPEVYTWGDEEEINLINIKNRLSRLPNENEILNDFIKYVKTNGGLKDNSALNRAQVAYVMSNYFLWKLGFNLKALELNFKEIGQEVTTDGESQDNEINIKNIYQIGTFGEYLVWMVHKEGGNFEFDNVTNTYVKNNKTGYRIFFTEEFKVDDMDSSNTNGSCNATALPNLKFFKSIIGKNYNLDKNENVKGNIDNKNSKDLVAQKSKNRKLRVKIKLPDWGRLLHTITADVEKELADYAKIMQTITNNVCKKQIDCMSTNGNNNSNNSDTIIILDNNNASIGSTELKLEIPSFNIIYNANFDNNNLDNENDDTVAEVQIKYGTKETLNSCKFSKKGYEFTGWTMYRTSDKKWYYSNGLAVNGWYTEEEAKSALSEYNPNKYVVRPGRIGSFISCPTIQNNDIIICYAQWIEAKSGSKYKKGDVNLDGNITSDDAKVIQKKLVNLIKLNAEQLEQADINCDGIVNIKDATLIDKYVEGLVDIKSYTIQFPTHDRDINCGKMEDQVVTYGYTVELQKHNFDYPGYKYNGWYLSRYIQGKVNYYYTNGSDYDWFIINNQPNGYYLKKFNGGENITNLSDINNDIIYVVEIENAWTPIEYNLLYFPNGGSGTMKPQTVTYNSSTNQNVLQNCNFKRLGYEFVGWTMYRMSDNKWYYSNGTNLHDWYTEDEAKTRLNNVVPKCIIRKGYNDGLVQYASTQEDDTIILYAQWKKYYYTSTSTLKSLPDKTLKINNKNVKFTNTQAIGVGSTYIYTVKPDTDKKNAIMYKTNKDTGNQVMMKHIRGGKKYDNITGIGYANDMSVASVNGYSTLFIATNDTASYSVVRMKVEGSTVTTTGNFNLYYNGSRICPSGIAKYGHSNGSVHFFFTSGNTVYKASIPDNKSSGNFNLTRVCYLNKTQAIINGVMRDVSSYGIQGIYYCNSNGGALYVPVTTDNAAVILVYQGFNSASGIMYAQSPLSFEVKGASGANLNVQGCGISSDGRLYFDVNRANNGDAILYFKV